MKKQSFKKILVMGGALFSMHFGASCMLYPVTWGRESGTSVGMAYAGVFLSGVLLTILGYTALARGQDTFWGLMSRATPRFGKFYCTVVALLVGPLYVVPRMSASAWDAACQLVQVYPDSFFPIILFNLVLYAVIYWFSTARTGVMDRIGKILTPLQLLIIAFVVIKGIIFPIAERIPAQSYTEPAIVYGFLQSYATGDLLCALLFGVVIIGDLRKENLDAKHLNKALLQIAAVGMGLLAVIHLGHMALGANIGDEIPLSYSALYAQAAVELWGKIGGAAFLAALIAAVISCGVGLTSSCIDYFSGMVSVNRRVSVAVLCVVSAAISCFNLNNIIALIGPLLDACYPSAILLVFYYTFMPDFERRNRKKGLACAIITAFLFAILHLLYVYIEKYNLPVEWYCRIYLAFPLAKHNFAWLPASFISYMIGSKTGSG